MTTFERRAVLIGTLLALSGCIDRTAGADPAEQDAAAIDATAPDLGPDTGQPDGSLQDAHLPPDSAVLDALPPPVDAASVETDCVLPPPPPVDCSPGRWDLAGAAMVPFEPVARDSQFDPARVQLADTCRIRFLEEGLLDLGSEAEFQAALDCLPGGEPVPSQVDWSTSRLVLAVVPEGLGAVTWAVRQDGQTYLGVEVGTQCGGEAPQAGFVGVFLPANAPRARTAHRCWPDANIECCACEVICDPEPRLGECVCPP